jgi:hypothetical protein
VANDIRMSNDSVDAQANAWAALANSGYLRIYTVPRPATADDVTGSATLLAELRMNAAAFATAVNGLLVAAAISPEDSALDTGDAVWYRLLQSNGTSPLCDGTVGVAGGAGFDMELVGTITITAGLPVNVTSFTHTVTK